MESYRDPTTIPAAAGLPCRTLDVGSTRLRVMYAMGNMSEAECFSLDGPLGLLRARVRAVRGTPQAEERHGHGAARVADADGQRRGRH